MQFIPTPSSSETLESLVEKYSELSEKQRESGRFFPCIISGMTGSGKDTLIHAVQQVLAERFLLIISPTQSRYLTRERRVGEENSQLNFISETDFHARGFGFSYEYSGNLYGLDTEKLKKELSVGNRTITNGSPKELAKLFDCLFYLIGENQLPPLIIYTLIGIDDNERLLRKRGGNEKEIQTRFQAIAQGDTLGISLQKIHRYQPYFHRVQRKPSENGEVNQENFNQNVLNVIERICQHITKYLSLSPLETQTERVNIYQTHRDSRP